ncbi:hypothetical protein B296_00004196 [Ensete ventricosum]|uniref:Uncharacterized protein n=1 Tax=Ensete ventricosum TaxID=4639 RepID=A0A426Z046_ENSVE|nr:hypothetical protein B296_00004196 [Ensete ventricosum]
MLVGAYRPCGLTAADRPLWRGPWPLPVAPLEGPLATVGLPLQVAKSWPAASIGDLAVAGRPSSSLLRLLRKRSKNT